jgi:hypothetical protein
MLTKHLQVRETSSTHENQHDLIVILSSKAETAQMMMKTVYLMSNTKYVLFLKQSFSLELVKMLVVLKFRTGDQSSP